MKTYEFSFTGRQSGAIGTFYRIHETYKAKSMSEAKSMLYEDYEHIQQLVTDDYNEFEKAMFITVSSHSIRRTTNLKTGEYNN